MRKGTRNFLFLIYLIFGLYFLNHPFQIVKIPESFATFEQWIIFIGGILIIFGAINFIRLRRHMY